MRKRTIKRRLRLSQLNDKHIDSIFRKMYGVLDEDTLHGEGNYFWYKAVRKAIRDQEKEDKKAGIMRFVKTKETLAESLENLGEAWKRLVDAIRLELRWLKIRFGKEKKDVENNGEDATKRK